jgi:hypothetical protein
MLQTETRVLVILPRDLIDCPRALLANVNRQAETVRRIPSAVDRPRCLCCDRALFASGDPFDARVVGSGLDAMPPFHPLCARGGAPGRGRGLRTRPYERPRSRRG